jgi:hypothetical protein
MVFAACNPAPAPDTCGPGVPPSSMGAGGFAGAAGAEADPAPEPPRERPDAGLETVVSDAYVSDIEVSTHDQVGTVLVVHWTQTRAAEQTWLEFGLADEPSLPSRPGGGASGPHRDVALGVPGDADVTLQVVSKQGNTAYKSSPVHAHTRPVPSGMPRPQVLSYHAGLASRDRWLFGSVEDSVGGAPYNYYAETFWLYIIDRRGRIVWYYADPASNATTSFQRRARDGEYIVFEKRCFGCGSYPESIVKMTLDYDYFEEVAVDGLADAIDVTEEGSLLYDAESELREMTADGAVRSIWSCRDHFGPRFDCYTNTVNYDPRRNTVLMSYPYSGTVVEVSRATGQLVGQYGNARGSWSFAPPVSTPPSAWKFEFQHFPNFSPQGTLMVSSHMPGCTRTDRPVAYQHAFLEFELDREQERLVEKWHYRGGPEWPRAKGMAISLPNGNTPANYGTGGVIREITPSHRTAWLVKFDVPEGNDFYNKMVGNNELIDDLYALNGAHPGQAGP